jgi:ABC-2 type transport system permease protein
MTRALFLLELRRSRGLLGWLLLLVFAYCGILAVVFPTIAENAAQLEAAMAAYPPEVLAAFGIEGSLAEPGVYYTSNVGLLLWPIVATMAGVILATRPTAVDTARGWVELPMSGHFTRTRYLATSVVLQASALAVLAGATIGSFLLVGHLVGAGLNPGPFALAGVAAWVQGCLIAAAASLLGVVTLSRGIAGGLTAGVLILMYLLRVIANVVDDLAWMADFSIFRYLYPTTIIEDGRLPVAEVAAFVGLSAGAWAASVFLFRRRDLIA